MYIRNIGTRDSCGSHKSGSENKNEKRGKKMPEQKNICGEARRVEKIECKRTNRIRSWIFWWPPHPRSWYCCRVDDVAAVVQCAAFPVAAQDRQAFYFFLFCFSRCVSFTGACVSLLPGFPDSLVSPALRFFSDSQALNSIQSGPGKTCLLGPAIDFFEFFRSFVLQLVLTLLVISVFYTARKTCLTKF